MHLQSSPLPFDLKGRSSLPVSAISAGCREQPEGWSFVSCQSKGFRPHGDRWWRNRSRVGGYSTKGCQHMGSLLHELTDNWDGKEQRSGRDKTAEMGVILTAFKGQLHVRKCQDVLGHLLFCLSTQLPDHTAFFCSDKACRFKGRCSHCICIHMEVNWSCTRAVLLLEDCHLERQSLHAPNHPQCVFIWRKCLVFGSWMRRIDFPCYGVAFIKPELSLGLFRLDTFG